MNRKSKSKITTDHKNALSVENPFARINLENLPDKAETGSSPDIAIPEDRKAKSKGRLKITREKSGRAGKLVTILHEFPAAISIEELSLIATELKKQCACGGSLKGRTIELQGDVSQQAMTDLSKRGFEPVRCGY